MKRTKIIATLGPASKSESIILKLASAGMDIARINMSHGNYESHQEIIDNFYRVKKQKKDLMLMIDTKGPEIRVGKFLNNAVFLKNHQIFTLTTKNIIGDETKVSITYKDLINDVKIGTKIFANNGQLVLKVVEITNEDIITKVMFGGKLTNNKGINVPNIVPQTKFLSENDKSDLLFAIKNNVDFVSASFISNKNNVLEIRNFLDKNNGKNIKIISKIENFSGVKNIEEIIKVSDGIMVARGDLGVEIALEKLPAIQKKIINLCNNYDKFCIVATEMLESMTESIRPTRAEVSDVANAVFELASATMLSGETAVGKYPVLALKTMKKTIVEAEKYIYR